MSPQDILLRLSLAVVAGMVLGYDREMRGIAAGIRTHGLVGLSSAVITISALLLYEQLRAAGNEDIDPLRAIQGLAQAIGFIAAGAIFVSKGDVHNLTSAATLWLAASVGIAAGAGQFLLIGGAVFYGVVLLTVVRLLKDRWPGARASARPTEHDA